jgi:hypothetical protein
VTDSEIIMFIGSVADKFVDEFLTNMPSPPYPASVADTQAVKTPTSQTRLIETDETEPDPQKK